MAKNKLFKIEKEEKIMIDAFVNAVEERVASNAYVTVTFEEAHNDAGYCKSAMLDYGKYKVRLFYNPAYFFSNYLDFKLLLGGRYEYTIYDIFNLFDIQDFRQYYHTNIETDYDLKGCVKNVLEVVDKYSYDIEKAVYRTSDLDANVETDYKTTFPKDDEETWSEDANDILAINIIHPLFTSVSDATDSDKLLKKLQKNNSKNKLTTNYEKRMLAYLEQGNSIVNENYIEKQAQTKGFSRVCATAIVLIVAAVSVVFIAIICINRYVVFSGAYMPAARTDLFGISLPFAFDDVKNFVLAVLITVIGFYFLLGKWLIKIISGNNESYLERFDKANFSNSRRKKINVVLTGIVSIVFIIVGFIICSMQSSSIGFYEDYIKFNDLLFFDTCTVSYDDVQIVQILGENEDEYIEYSDHVDYVFYDGKQSYYELNNIDPEGETAKRIDSIINGYGKSVTEYKTIMDFTDNING